MLSEEIPTEHVACDLCGSKEQRVLHIKRDYVTGQNVTLVECSCGMAFVNPMPTVEAIPRLYPEEYLKDKPLSHSLYKEMLKLLPRHPSGSLLDIGCGRGDFIARASEAGWKAEGVDLIAWENPSDLSIRVGDFPTMDFPQDHYDVITAWAVLEHVRSPSLFFQKISRLLKHDGVFLFTAPNFEALGMRTSCTEDIPQHLSLFSKRSVFRHLSNVGLEARKIYHTDKLYTCYPFGLFRYAISRLNGREEIRCSAYDNLAVRLLQNRQFKGHARTWLKQVVTILGPKDLALDFVDIFIGLVLAEVSKLVRNYGVMTVVAGKPRQKKSNPNEEDC